MKRDEFFVAWSGLHGGAKIEGVVKTWLLISFALVKILAKLKVSPNFLTFSGLAFAIALWQFPDIWVAAIFLTLSLLFDGIDGSLAIITQRSSRLGAFLDSFVDRLTEVFWALALYELGAPAQFIYLALLFAFTQEYLRARAGGLGHGEVGLVTICERPVRASLIFFTIILNILNFDVANLIGIIWAAMQFIALLQLTLNTYKRLVN